MGPPELPYPKPQVGIQPVQQASHVPFYKAYAPALSAPEWVNVMGKMHEHERRVAGRSSEPVGYYEPPTNFTAGAPIHQPAFAQPQQHVAQGPPLRYQLAGRTTDTGASAFPYDAGVLHDRPDNIYDPNYGMQFFDWDKWDADRSEDAP